ncbi:MAG: FtsQ-type POTRA domain-containing protein [Rhodospirillaceae bacterium]|nr:FtsQ-type POTRA domain-containing protein [Rhodospirillaceae bacterium]MBT5944603.1 FtsQ-type POTRA domain-containing protein [Rhodospirillaceae bacterium]MBT6405093.1 FtsQ-type POTRA domain-containing protein [Rhodospirillaceae bacterium]MBT6536660.1 FtsQ-type POTRA domain-containing protein [Rhodospirillaceae bacterium]MBT7362507.1 FtsQ-type POTRA domain-containing protein [Rhodospirillaceae bacterium]
MVAAGVYVAVIAAVGGGAWQLSANGWIDAQTNALGTSILEVSANVGLRVEDVVLSGRQNADAVEILAALDIERGSPIFAMDMNAARDRIESLGWVRSAEIARRLPDIVFVRVVERQPLAIWQHDGQAALVDRFGKTIQRSGLDAFAHLPLIVGDGAPDHAAQLIDLLQTYPAVAKAIEAAVRVSERRWNLRLRNGIDVRLPEQNISAALTRLDDFQREHALLDRDVVAVDLRVPDRLIVRVGRDSAPRPKAEGKDT